jgi:anti-anti-sigma regulatory factor
LNYFSIFFEERIKSSLIFQNRLCSSSGLRVILKTAKVLKPKNGTAALCNTNKQIHEVLEISVFLDVVKAFDSLDDAMTFVNS